MKRIISALLVFATYWSMFVPFASIAGAQTVADARNNRMKDVPQGLTFSLSEGADGAETRVKQQLAPSDPLSGVDAANLLKRLPEIKAVTGDESDFAKRAGTLPAPKTGKQIPVKFPSDEGRGTPKVNPGTSRRDPLLARGRNFSCP